MTAGNDYLASPFYCLFTNLAICGNPIAVLYNTPFLVFPFSTWGAYADYSPREDFLFKVAVYNNNPDIKRNKYHGCNFTFKSTAGVTWLTEWAYHLNQRKIDKGYHGNYRVGGFFQTGKIAKFEGGSQTGNYGLYFLLDQMLYRKQGPGTTQGLSFFGSFLYSPPNRSLFPFYFDMGLVYKGIIPSRPKDYLNFGVAYGRYSSDLRHEEENNKRLGITGFYGDRPQTSETILELNYWIRCSDWFAITPDLQYVITPKGYGSIPNAFVLQVQLSLDLIGVPKQP